MIKAVFVHNIYLGRERRFTLDYSSALNKIIIIPLSGRDLIIQIIKQYTCNNFAKKVIIYPKTCGIPDN